MKYFISSIQFLTILRIGKSEAFDPKGVVSCFPLVGLIIGFFLMTFDIAASYIWQRPVAAVIDVVMLIVITGALHIDGLGDSADGLFSHRDREKALEIMKDSRIGVMGTVTIICASAIKWGGLMSLDTARYLFLFIIPAYARTSMMFGFKFLQYGRPGGLGSSFSQTPLTVLDFRWCIIPICFSFFAGWRGVGLNLFFVFLIVMIIRYYRSRIGCITGDMLGAMCEITESLLFLWVSI